MKWLHNLLKGASLTTALFVFQDPQGVFQPKDTVLFDLREREIVIKLNEVR